MKFHVSLIRMGRCRLVNINGKYQDFNFRNQGPGLSNATHFSYDLIFSSQQIHIYDHYVPYNEDHVKD